MALPFIPLERIPSIFELMLNRASASERLMKLCQYFKETWMNGRYDMASWNCFMRPTRTNNDVEGWHRRINHAARDASSPFYVLIPLLHGEAEFIPLQRQMISEGTLSRVQRKSTRRLQAKFFELWGKFNNKKIKTSTLLTMVSRMNGPQE